MFWSRSMDRRINHLHERALRLVYNDYVSSFEELLEKDGSVKLHHRCIRKVAIIMFKVRRNLCPPFMNEILIFSENSKSLTCGEKFLRPHIIKVKYGEFSLRSFGPIVWNQMLPEELKECTELDKFKDEIKCWVPRNCPCRLCKVYIQNLGFL